jgi:hypothetical protein
MLAFPVAGVIGFGGQAVMRHAWSNDATTAAPAHPERGTHDDRLYRDDEGNTEAPALDDGARGPRNA